MIPLSELQYFINLSALEDSILLTLVSLGPIPTLKPVPGPMHCNVHIHWVLYGSEDHTSEKVCVMQLQILVMLVLDVWKYHDLLGDVFT